MLVGQPRDLRALVLPHRATWQAVRGTLDGLIDGPIFDDRGPQYLLKQGGVVLSAARLHGPTLGVSGNTAYFSPDPDDRWPTALGGFAAIVTDGRVTTSPDRNTEHVGRASMGILTTGQVFLALSTGETMVQHAQDLVTLGAKYALYTDGGSSTQGALGTYALTPSNVAPVPSFIGLAAPAAPRQVLTLLALGALGYAAYRYTHRRTARRPGRRP